MEVYKCGSKATTIIGKIEGIITGISIRFGKVQYELSYFEKGKHETAWVEECEITSEIKERNNIGYK